MAFHGFLTFSVSAERFDIILISLLFVVSWYFSFAAFSTLSLFCSFGLFSIM
jgi:hypothetical protein